MVKSSEEVSRSEQEQSLLFSEQPKSSSSMDDEGMEAGLNSKFPPLPAALLSETLQ